METAISKQTLAKILEAEVASYVDKFFADINEFLDEFGRDNSAKMYGTLQVYHLCNPDDEPEKMHWSYFYRDKVIDRLTDIYKKAGWNVAYGEDESGPYLLFF